MARPRRARLFHRISVPMLALVVVAIAVPAVLTVVEHARELREKMTTGARGNADVIALTSADFLVNDDVDRLRELVAMLKHENADIVAAAFIDKQGVVVADSDPDREGQVEAGSVRPTVQCDQNVITGADGVDHLVLTAPIRVSGEPWGTFREELTLASLDAASRQTMWRVTITGLVLLCIGGVVARWLARSISRPIERLAATAVQVARGRLDVKSGVASDDEVGELAVTFDAMTAELATKNRALREHSETLELHVQERTELLRLKETLLRSMAETSPLAFLVVDHTHDRVLYCNHRLAQLWSLGDEMGPAPGSSYDGDLLPELASRVRDQAAFLAATAGQSTGDVVVVEDEVTLLDDRILRRFTAPVIGDDGTAFGQLYIYEDISRRKRAETELGQARDAALEAARTKSEFLANMSHEIRTPMNGVLGFVDLLSETKLTARQRDYLDTVRVSGETLLAILNDILDFSKIEAGRIELEQIDFAPRELVESVSDLFAPKAQDKKVEFLCGVSSRVPARLKGDPTRLRQVVMNLVGNAIKFTERGEVVVEASGSPRSDGRFGLEIRVRDTGVGIPEQQIGRLFQAFVQADGSTTRRFGGTGLGLAITRRLIDLMGGTIDIESQVGAGTVFIVRVPLATTARAAVLAPPESFRGMRVLVVDDNPTNRQLVDELLTSFGVESISVPGGHEALATMREAARLGRPFRIALLDMQMPGMDGLMLAEQVRGEPKLAAVKMILLTSMKFASSITAREKGLAAVLAKPVKRASLLDTLVATLEEDAAAPREIVSAPPASTTAAADPDARRELGRGIRLLLAEDNPVNQKLAKDLLARLGVDVSVANDGRETVEIWQRGGIDMILMDVQMPRMDGNEATAAIREKEGSRRRTPIVAMTAHAMAGDREKCLAAGMDDYITKPIRLDELARVVARWGRGRAESEMDLPMQEGRNWTDVIERLKEIGLLDEPELLAETIELFLSDAATMLTQMKAAHADNDASGVDRCAHRIKGAALNLGVSTISAPAKTIEENARKGELTGTSELMATLERELAEVGRFLRGLSSKGGVRV